MYLNAADDNGIFFLHMPLESEYKHVTYYMCMYRLKGINSNMKSVMHLRIVLQSVEKTQDMKLEISIIRHHGLLPVLPVPPVCIGYYYLCIIATY